MDVIMRKLHKLIVIVFLFPPNLYMFYKFPSF